MSYRTSENYHNSLKHEESYDDTYIREQIESFYLKYFGKKLIDNPDGYGIDKLYEDDRTRGIELEHGGWDNDDFWNDEYYAHKCGYLDYPHVNVPYRKLKFWINELLPKKTRDGYWVKRPNIKNFKDTIFIRCNQDLTQFIIIRPDAFLTKKYVITDIYCSNSDEIEKFMSFRREDVETYNIIDGVLIRKL